MKETKEIFPKNSWRVRKSEWEEVGMKDRRNEDGSKWNQDSNIRFTLRLDAMNTQKGEAVCWSKKAGDVWLEVRKGQKLSAPMGACNNSKQTAHRVNLLNTNILMLPRSHTPFFFLCRAIKHKQYLCAQTKTYSLPPEAIFFFIVLHKPVCLWLWINCLEKARCHLLTVRTDTIKNTHFFQFLIVTNHVMSIGMKKLCLKKNKGSKACPRDKMVDVLLSLALMDHW